MGRTALQEAEEALHRADVDAGNAGPVARDAVRRARRERDQSALSVAQRAWGRSLLQTGDVAAAVAHLERAVAAAVLAGSDELAVEARIPLGAALAQRGRPEHALGVLDLAAASAGPAGRARALAQRADVLHQAGAVDGVLAAYDEAAGLLRAVDDALNLQRCLVNRGILHTELHHFAAAERDLVEADRIAAGLGRELARGIIAENLGYLETLRGDVPAALARLDVAQEVIGRLGGQVGFVDLDRAELLLGVGVGSEAGESARRAAVAFAEGRRALMVPLATLVAAQSALLEGDHAQAARDAAYAGRRFGAQRRREYAALARLVGLEAGLAAGGPAPDVAAVRLGQMVEDLTRAGWPVAAVRSRIVAARLLDARGRPGEAEALLVDAAAARRRGPAAVRAQGWHAAALLGARARDRRALRRAVRSGLRVLDAHATALGASDLRAYSSVHRRELAGIGLRDAVAHGSARDLLTWSEHARANRLFRRSLVPPDDPLLAELLAQLRAVRREPTAGQDTAVARLERRIRDRIRQVPDAAEPGTPPLPPLGELHAMLGEQVLLGFVEQDGRLHVVRVADGRVVRREVGSSAVVADLVDRLTFALRRLTRDASHSSYGAARALLEEAARALDRLLLADDLRGADRPLVVVPTGPLHNLAWAVLPSLAGRAVSTTPSVRLWSTSPPEPRPGVLVVAGPGLPGADAEARSVAGVHSEAEVLTGEQADAASVLGRVGQVGLLHLAAHGRLAAPNPLFSSLLLADGPLVAYDLERSPRLPATVVLASCEGGRLAVHSGDALLGLGASFVARGTARLVASVVPVWDAETVSLMTRLHAGLAGGRSVAGALATAQQEAGADDVRALAAAAGFVCVATRDPALADPPTR